MDCNAVDNFEDVVGSDEDTAESFAGNLGDMVVVVSDSYKARLDFCFDTENVEEEYFDSWRDKPDNWMES